MRSLLQKSTILAVTTLLCSASFLAPVAARAEGRVVVYADDWSLSDFYYSPSAKAFGLNVCNWLTGCSATKRLLFDDTYNLYLPHTQFDAALLSNGFTVDRIPTASWTPALLAGYDAVLMENAPVDAAMLKAYQAGGGGLFILGGGGLSDAMYNPLLAYYDLSFSPLVNSPEITTTFDPHPITTGVSELIAGRPSPINLLGPGPQVLSFHGGINWLAIAGSLTPCAPTASRRQTWGAIKSHYR